jgi:hypothetical protein
MMMSTRLGFHWHSATGWRPLHPRALPASILDRDPGLDLSHGGWPTPGRVPDHPPAILDGPDDSERRNQIHADCDEDS